MGHKDKDLLLKLCFTFFKLIIELLVTEHPL